MEKFSLLEIVFNKDEQNGIDDSARGKNFFSRQFSGSVTKRLKRILSTRVFKFAHGFSYFLSHISTRIYGSALLTFGLVSLMMYFLGLSEDFGILTPVIAILFSLFSIPFLLIDKPLPIFLQDFAPTDYLFFEFFCMKRHTMLESPSRFPVFGAVVIGFVLAALSFFLPLWQIALVIGIAVCIYIGIESPEFVFLVSIFALPFLRFIPDSHIWLSAAVILALVSFLVKVLYGKRVIYIEQYDIFLGLMMLFVLISGIFVKGMESFSGSVLMIILSLGYVLAGNIITNQRLADRSVNSVVMSGALASLISITQLIVILVRVGRSVTADDLSLVLAREDGMAVFLIASIIFGVGMIKQSSMPARVVYVCATVLSVIALIISGEFFALTAVILGIGVYYIIKNNKYPVIFLPLILLLSLLVLLLPNSALNVVFNYSPSVVSAEELFDLWYDSLVVLADNLFVGIGIGSESFAEEMAAIGTFGYNDSSNLFIELGLEAGVFALIFFFCIVLTRLNHRSIQYLYLRNSQIESLSNASGVCMFSLLAFGMVNYIWSDLAAYYFFWCIFGIGSATLRVAKKDYDDKVIYYEETSAFDSSVIDIEIG